MLSHPVEISTEHALLNVNQLMRTVIDDLYTIDLLCPRLDDSS